jgi:hemerythrin-like metal-binding protein
MRRELLAEVFPWREEYSVGIPKLDEQHKTLVRLINDLRAAMLGRQGDSVLGTLFEELIEYTRKHMALEERLMRECAYPGLRTHRADHKRLARNVYALRDKFLASRLSISVEVLQFLRQWLTVHIMEHDQAYVGWLAPKE